MADFSVRKLDGDNIPDSFAEQRAADRRLIGDHSVKAVRLCAAHDRELKLLLKFHIVETDGASDIDICRAHLILSNDLGILEDLLDLLDAGFDVSLLILRSIVLGIFGKVTLLTGFFDLLGNSLALVDLQVIQLILKLGHSAHPQVS